MNLKHKYRLLFLIFLLIIVSIVSHFLISDQEIAILKAKCTDNYHDPLDNWTWGYIFSPGFGDADNFIDCGGNLVIKERRDDFVPNPNYRLVVDDYSKSVDDFKGNTLVYFDNKGRYQFDGLKLYVYSDFESPTYYVIDIITGKIEKSYKEFSEMNVKEVEIFDKILNSFDFVDFLVQSIENNLNKGR